MRRLILVLAVAVLLTACKTVPLDSHLTAHELVASAGVMSYFSDPDVMSVEAGENIQCKRHRRVGTHLISKVCMTRDEWDERERQTRDTHTDRMSPACMPAAVPGASYMDSSLRAALLPTTCGDSINR